MKKFIIIGLIKEQTMINVCGLCLIKRMNMYVVFGLGNLRVEKFETDISKLCIMLLLFLTEKDKRNMRAGLRLLPALPGV